MHILKWAVSESMSLIYQISRGKFYFNNSEFPSFLYDCYCLRQCLQNFLKITQISQINQCFQRLNVICIHIYGDALNGLPRLPVSKNVNNERTSAKICYWFVQQIRKFSLHHCSKFEPVLKLNLYATGTLVTEESRRCGEVAVIGR